MKRSLDRFAEIDSGRVHDRDSDHYLDEVYTFFQNCYHLKDWLINDPTFASNRDEVEAYINAHVELQLCADICNAHKHLRLDRPRSTEDPKMGAKKFFVDLGGATTSIRAKYQLDTASGPRDAFDLAKKSAELWHSFIKGKGGAV